MSEYYPSDEEATDDGSSSLCTESTTSTMESFSEIKGQLTTLSGLMEVLMNQTTTMESQMKTMQRPFEGMALNQLGDIPHLAASPFRKQTFAYKRALPGVDPAKRYSFETICGHFRAYIFGNNLVDAEGNIVADAILAELLEIQSNTKLNFMELLGRLRRCVQ
jgi:hypothetical protein